MGPTQRDEGMVSIASNTQTPYTDRARGWEQSLDAMSVFGGRGVCRQSPGKAKANFSAIVAARSSGGFQDYKQLERCDTHGFLSSIQVSARVGDGCPGSAGAYGGSAHAHADACVVQNRPNLHRDDVDDGCHARVNASVRT